MEKTWLEYEGTIYGAKADKSGPIGGGRGYANGVTDGDIRVNSVESLIAALEQAKKGETVFIEDHIELDLTDWVFADQLALSIREGVTLAGSRGNDGSQGPLLYSDAYATSPLIRTMGPNVRITGLRLRGPDPKRRLAFHYRVFVSPGKDKYEVPHKAYYCFPNSDGISSSFSGLQVDNCEISGWSHGGIRLKDAGRHHIHHNFIHHCQRMGLGYGISLARKSEALIEYNLFQDNKHHIAGTGEPGQGYEARHNVVLAYTEPHPHPVEDKPYGQDHIFDMHGGRDRRDDTDIAGAWLKIYNNTFYPSYVPVKIRGVPEKSAEIHHNWFCGHDIEKAKVVISGGNTTTSDNIFSHNPKMD